MTTILDELMKDISNVKRESTQVNAEPKIKNDSVNKRKEYYLKTKDKTLLQRKIKYKKDSKKLTEIRMILEKAFKGIPDPELLLLTNKRIIISRDKHYKLEYRIIRR